MLFYFLFIPQAQFKHLPKKKKKPSRIEVGPGPCQDQEWLGWKANHRKTCRATLQIVCATKKLTISRTACQWSLSGRHSTHKWNTFYFEKQNWEMRRFQCSFRLKGQQGFLTTKHGCAQFFNLKLLTVLGYWWASGVCSNLKFEKEHGRSASHYSAAKKGSFFSLGLWFQCSATGTCKCRFLGPTLSWDFRC